jgi:hypothetical protein
MERFKEGGKEGLGKEGRMERVRKGEGKEGRREERFKGWKRGTH